MSYDDNDVDGSDCSRRTFIKGAGLATGGALLGVGSAGTAAAHSEFSTEFANPRVREAAKVWESKPWRQGFRGRPDRTLALNDSGIDPSHPDLNPWNGVTAVSEERDDPEYGSGGDQIPEIRLAGPDALKEWRASREPVGGEQKEDAVLGPGTTVEGSETVVAEFAVPEGEDVEEIVDMDAELSWTPQNVPLPDATPVLSSAGEDQSFRVDLRTPDGDWVPLQTVDTGSNPETLNNVTVVPGATHRFVAGQFANVVAEGTVTWRYFTYESDLTALDDGAIFDFSDFDRTPKTVGWFDAGSRYGSHDEPADPDGHGSHVSGIMTGSGRASTVDTESDSFTAESPGAVLTAGDFLEYEVEADPGTGLFGVATGTGIEVLIEGPEGRTLRRSGAVPVLDDKEALPIDDARVDHPTVDDRHPTDASGEPRAATYTIYVRPLEGQAVSTGRVEEVVVGPFRDPDEVAGDRDSGDVSLHSGFAPDAGIVGLQGLSGPAASLGLYADQFAPLFNVRAVNMSWGGLVPGGGSVGGSSEEASVKRIAEGGILTVAAAGNNFGTVNTAPAIADEAVSVAATNYLDGVTGYSDGGAQAQDEDEEGSYGKPDLCAPGGSLDAGARAVKAEAEGGPTAGVDGVRDYVNLAGTSMASPYVTGVAGVVSQAMEEGAPESLRLPAPKELHDGYTADERLEHVLRLKSVLTSTASSTAFTAAPYHRHAVTYRHTGRDTYEGFGRVNPDAAVDAVTRDLLADAAEENGTLDASTAENVGLDVPDDSRAVAGYVELDGGTLEVSLEHTHYGGGNQGMAQGAPWLDLFVYRADEPGVNGEPNVVASAMGRQGSASVTVEVDGEAPPEAAVDASVAAADAGAFFVVAKLVNVPGVVNGYDVRSHFDLTTTFDPAPPEIVSATGSRQDDGSVYVGQSNQIDVTVQPTDTEITVADRIPVDWETSDQYSGTTFEREENLGDGTKRVVFSRTVAAADDDGGETTFTYFATAPKDAQSTGPAEFVAEAKPDAPGEFSDAWASIEGTSATYVVVGASTDPGDAGSSTSSTASTDGTVEEVTDSLP